MGGAGQRCVLVSWCFGVIVCPSELREFEVWRLEVEVEFEVEVEVKFEVGVEVQCRVQVAYSNIVSTSVLVVPSKTWSLVESEGF